MISGRDFLVLSDEWDGLPTSTIHLFRHIAPRNRVFWLNIINRLPRLCLTDFGKVTGVLGKWCGGSCNARESSDSCECESSGVLYSATPFIIPWFKPAIRRLNCKSLRRRFDYIDKRFGLRDPIVLTTWPSTTDFVKSVSPALKIYYCVDEWLDYPGLKAADFRTMEDDLLANVDGFVATSRDLERKGAGCRRSLYLPHGVDCDHFCNGHAGGPAPEMEEISRPIVGFFGLIAEWIDVELIATLSERFPDVSFVLIGKALVPTDALQGRRNVSCLGPVPYAELPRYARHFDVGLVPFRQNALTQAANPLKLLEYLALGLPVLGTRLPELERVGGPVHLASTPDEFCAKLRDILNDSTFRPEDAREVAKQNTWKQRAEALSKFIEALSRSAE